VEPKALALYSNLQSDLMDQFGDIFDFESKSVKPDVPMTPKVAAAASILNSFLKKFRVENTDSMDSKALLKFLTVNKAVGDWRLQLETDDDHILFGELRRAIWEFWNVEGPPGRRWESFPLVTNYRAILDEGRCGPGASILGGGGDEYTKMYSSALSCTSQFLYDEYRDYVSEHPDTDAAEVLRDRDFEGVAIVEGSRLSFVPKNDQISRCICIEPTLNMFYQLGFGAILERRLSTHFGIEMGSQQFKNRELARIGSTFDNLCTIDLESASDSLGLKMLEAVLPRDFMSFLLRLRSPSSDLPGIGSFALDMVSTMGNGFTFPLQTMLFASVVIAAFRAHGIRPYYPRGRNNGNFGVFGDDIIVPQEIVVSVFRLLRILGFVVNSSKTFVKGPFRESCGSDFYQGINIRGVYLKSIRSIQDRFVAINQLNLFSTRTGVRLSRTVQQLLLEVPWTPVPIWENDDSGVRIPFSVVKDSLRHSRKYQSVLYTKYEPVASKVRIGESGFRIPRRVKARRWNPYGLYLCFLRRSINAMSFSIRLDRVRYRKRLGVAPNWDTPPTAHPLTGWFPWKRCESAFYLNLFG
jgi:hypothetical protein